MPLILLQKRYRNWFKIDFLFKLKAQNYNTVFKTVVIVAIAINFFLSAVVIAKNDIFWNSDISRDFLILDEIRQKKIVLVGPRSYAAPGLFHGPLWSYLNFPAFYLGNENPVVAGWFWVILNGIFLASCFYVGRKLLNPTAAYLFTLLVSVRMIGITKSFFNPTGAMILLPIFIYLLVKYNQTQKIKYLILHVLAGGLIVQLQVAVGIPFLILSLLYVLFTTIKIRKNYNHLFAYLLISLTLVSYLIFDLRHEFLMTKAVVNYLSANSAVNSQTLALAFMDRAQVMMSAGLSFFPEPNTNFNYILFILVSVGVLLAYVKKTKYPFLIFWYFYLGFFALSFVQKTDLSSDYYLPLFPVAFLAFFSLSTYINKKIFYVLTIGIVVLNLNFEIGKLSESLNNKGEHQTSWQFHNKIAIDIFETANIGEFGMFVYSPEGLAYRSKYPFVYQQRHHPDTKMVIQEKKKETYVLLAGPPEKPIPWEFDPEGYLRDGVSIYKDSMEKWQYNDKYSVEKFYLTSEEIKVPFDINVNNWLNFR